MTDQQAKVFDTVCSLLSEHFDCSVVSVSFTNEESGEGYSKHCFNGGRVNAIGLVRVSEQEMVHEQISQNEVEE